MSEKVLESEEQINTFAFNEKKGKCIFKKSKKQLGQLRSHFLMVDHSKKKD